MVPRCGNLWCHFCPLVAYKGVSLYGVDHGNIIKRIETKNVFVITINIISRNFTTHIKSFGQHNDRILAFQSLIIIIILYIILSVCHPPLKLLFHHQHHRHHRHRHRHHHHQRLGMTLAVAEALSPNKPRDQSVYHLCINVASCIINVSWHNVTSGLDPVVYSSQIKCSSKKKNCVNNTWKCQCGSVINNTFMINIVQVEFNIEETPL